MSLENLFPWKVRFFFFSRALGRSPALEPIEIRTSIYKYSLQP